MDTGQIEGYIERKERIELAQAVSAINGHLRHKIEKQSGYRQREREWEGERDLESERGGIEREGERGRRERMGYGRRNEEGRG